MGIVSAIAARLIITTPEGDEIPLVKTETWVPLIESWGEAVALNRRYIDGEHRLDLNDNMAKMLRIDIDDDERFSVNYSALVVNKMVSRMKIEQIVAVDGGDPGQDWVDNVKIESRFDEIQIDINSDTLGDGDTFAIVDPPRPTADKQYVTFVPELAFDGLVGVIPVYDRINMPMVAAAKIWEEARFEGRRVNIYFPDHVERYEEDGDSLILLPDDGEPDEQWVDISNKPLGVPFGHFRNNKKTGRTFGRSEPAKIRPLQDVLNKTYMSMVMTAENTAFQRLFAKGFKPSGAVSPGSIISAYEPGKGNAVKLGVPKDREVDLKEIPSGQITPLVEEAVVTVDMLSQVSETPLPVASANVSGESLKQREIGLIGKVKTVEIKIGNVWGDLFRMGARVQRKFGTITAPEMRRFNTVWSDPEVRNKKEIVENAVKIEKWVDAKTLLTIVEPAMPFDAAQIDDIIKAKTDEQRKLISQLTQTNPRTPPTQDQTNGAVAEESPELNEIAEILGG